MISVFGNNNFALIIGTVVSLVSFVSIIFSTDPNSAGILVFVLFFLTFFLSVTGLATLIGSWFRKKLIRGSRYDYSETNFRQGVIVGLTAVILLILKAQSLFLWWVILPIILFFILLEIFFQTQRTKNAQ